MQMLASLSQKVTGLDITAQQVRGHLKKSPVYGPCQQSNQTRLPRIDSSESKAPCPMYRLHADLCGSNAN